MAGGLLPECRDDTIIDVFGELEVIAIDAFVGDIVSFCICAEGPLPLHDGWAR
jgi:hypothetical protein